jgi:aminoglycoside phosphotransferase family enzyme/predicted kinase
VFNVLRVRHPIRHVGWFTAVQGSILLFNPDGRGVSMMVDHGKVDDRLVRALMNPALYDHPVESFQLIETHISWVLLTGLYAYKIKKPVNLGFLDFSTLEQRRYYCGEELRLNRRLASVLYLAVVPITGTIQAPRLGGEGAVIDYAVKMRQFPQESQVDRLIERGVLRVEQLDALAAELAAFHQQSDRATADDPFGSPERIALPMHENFVQIRSSFDTQAGDGPSGQESMPVDRADQLRRLQAWSEADHAAHRDVFMRRKAGGFVRECHGDLHLANMVLWEGRVLPFDCLEFDARLRWIDVMSDLAFVTMDLAHRGRPEWARRLLNAYLETTGDYAGLEVLRSYRVYRAMVRAKVAVLRRRQAGASGDRQRSWDEYCAYADLAERETGPLRPFLLMTHGLSGSGKTVVSQLLVDASGAVRVRSDVERKRLFGLAPSARSGSPLDAGLYSPEAGRRTYERLAELAGAILNAGYPAIVDGACLKRDQRDRLRSVAACYGAPCVILDVQAPEALVRERVRRRAEEGADASEAGLAVLERQIGAREPLEPDEVGLVRVRTEARPDPDLILAAVDRMVGRSARPEADAGTAPESFR